MFMRGRSILGIPFVHEQGGNKWFKAGESRMVPVQLFTEFTFVQDVQRMCKVVESKPIDLAVVARLFRAVQKWLYPGHCFVREVEAMRDVSP